MAYRQLPLQARCSCGYRRSHHFVSEEAEYTVIGWVLLIVGVTPQPRRVVYRCRRCDFIFGETTDPRILVLHD
jgi:hypothetical protein